MPAFDVILVFEILKTFLGSVSQMFNIHIRCADLNDYMKRQL